jgi:co-chaperonin GroES (HSP10)
VGVIKGIPKSEHNYSIGDKIIFDDSDSIDFTIDGVALSIVDEFDIVAKIKGDK